MSRTGWPLHALPEFIIQSVCELGWPDIIYVCITFQSLIITNSVGLTVPRIWLVHVDAYIDVCWGCVCMDSSSYCCHAPLPCAHLHTHVWSSRCIAASHHSAPHTRVRSSRCIATSKDRRALIRCQQTLPAHAIASVRAMHLTP